MNAYLKKVSTEIISFTSKYQGKYNITAETEEKDLEYLARRITYRTIGVTLGSGGVPGFAHLGALQVLKENAIPLDFIVGTSAGAICGAFYAYDVSEEQLKEFLQAQKQESPVGFSDFAFSKQGLFRGEKFIKLIKRLFGNKTIDQSHIPYAIVATDLRLGKEEVITSGPVMEGIRASCSLPIIFTPVKQKDKLLIDGAITCPVPVQVLE